jgi:hypothetical protein
MDRFSSLQEVSLGDLFIQTTRYEEYQAGKMISSGTTNALIKYTTLEDGRIKVIIGNNDLNDKLMSTVFDKCITSLDRLLLFSIPTKSNAEVRSNQMLRIVFGFTCNERIYKNIEPVVGSLFFENGKLVKVSFTMANPERLIEFYSD